MRNGDLCESNDNISHLEEIELLAARGQSQR